MANTINSQAIWVSRSGSQVVRASMAASKIPTVESTVHNGWAASGVLCRQDLSVSGDPCIVGEPRFDLVGRGTVTGTLCLDAPLAECGLSVPDGFEPARLVYRFAVAEPPTLSLLMLALVTTVVGLAFVHRRAAVNT